MTEDEKKAALRKAYGTATQHLRDNHRDEFNKLYSAEAAALGVEWSPRQTPEEKAEQAFDTLLRDYPFLRDRLAASGGTASNG